MDSWVKEEHGENHTCKYSTDLLKQWRRCGEAVVTMSNNTTEIVAVTMELLTSAYLNTRHKMMSL